MVAPKFPGAPRLRSSILTPNFDENFELLFVVVVVVLTLTRIVKSVVTGQAPVTLELRNTPGKTHTQPKVVHAYITVDAIHASTRNI